MLPAALVVFFLSGFAALLYQVTWQRLLAIFSGADVYSATLVIAAFMAGLGCGSLAGGHLADRLSRTGALLAFAAAEAGVAIFGFQSKTILYDVLYGWFAPLADNTVLTAAILFVTLLWPTSLMGASLPLLSRALTSSAAVAARNVGWLYGVNTMGAALGALLGIWVFLPRHGLEGTLQLSAWINVACAALALPVVVGSVVRQPTAVADVAGSSDASIPTSGRLPFLFWLAVFGLSGFIALSFELIWFRLLGVMLKSTAFTFGTLLAQYLFWLGLGSTIGSVFATRVNRPAPLFLALQTAAGLYAGVSLTFLIAQIDALPSLRWLHDYFGRYEPFDVYAAAGEIRGFINDAIWSSPTWHRLPGDAFRLYFGLPGLLIAPATLLMGISFPVLQRVVQTDTARLGRRIGALLMANIVGSTCGTMVTGWLLLAVAGTALTLKVMVLLSTFFAFASWRLFSHEGPLARTIAPWLAAGAVVTAIAMPSGNRLWAKLHGTAIDQMIVAEDGSGVSALKSNSTSFDAGVTMFINGLGQSHLPYGGIHTQLGALPALIHPNPASAAIIGLGSGDTLFAVAGRAELERIVSIEIVQPQLETLAALFERRRYRGLQAILHDRRIQHVFGDGRLHLATTGEKFDIIETDALRPNSAYAGNLYSAEYFGLLRDHLKPGGLAVTWVPTDRVTRTFLQAFEHAAGFGPILLGSNTPIRLDRAAIERRLTDRSVQHYFGAAGVDIGKLLRPLLDNVLLFGPDHARTGITDINTDVHPRDEFDIPEIFDPSLLRPEGSR
jgi:predicted membrane-bound spermidine synthase